MVKFAPHDNVFSDLFDLETGLVEGRSLQPKDTKGANYKEKNKSLKSRSLSHLKTQKFDFCAKMSYNMVLVERKACCHVANT